MSVSSPAKTSTRGSDTVLVNLMTRAILLCMLLSSAACGAFSGSAGKKGDGGADAGDAASPAGCRVTLSGAVSGSYACVPSLTWDASSNVSSFAIRGEGPSGVRLEGDISFSGAPKVTTYDSVSAAPTSSVVLVDGAANTWRALGTEGTFALTLSVVSAGDATSNGKAHGSLKATLRAVSGSSAVTLQATF